MSSTSAAAAPIADDAYLHGLRAANQRDRRRRRQAAILAYTLACTVAAAAFGLAVVFPAPLGEPPVGRRPLADQAILDFAASIHDGPFDHARGRYLYVQTREVGQMPTGTLSIGIRQTWQADDESGASSEREFRMPMSAWQESTVRRASFADAELYGFELPGHPTIVTPQRACPPGSLLFAPDAATPIDYTRATDVVYFISDAQSTLGPDLDCRRAILRALAVLTGPKLTGPAVDPLGRPGTAITIDTPAEHDELIFDRDTGMLLSIAMTDKGIGTVPPGPGLLQAFEQITRTDQRWPADAISYYPQPQPIGTVAPNTPEQP
ncbi:hypothetical protein [Hamadaea tsunoensis]|uniref:hypothetical protein n=1 Tax=Hamadaea tsunoensis TaxID=53368 RepID=UPI0004052E07|nr:hypothetical protein [Hamadaea tsunoensis]